MVVSSDKKTWNYSLHESATYLYQILRAIVTANTIRSFEALHTTHPVLMADKSTAYGANDADYVIGGALYKVIPVFRAIITVTSNKFLLEMWQFNCILQASANM